MQETFRRLKLSKDGKIGKKSQNYKKYGKSEQVRFINGQWILPVGYVQHKNPMCKKAQANIYTAEGRKGIHDNLAVYNKWIANHMAKNPVQGQSVEYNDNRVSLFAAQWGKCAIPGREFLSPDEVHCHHKVPRGKGGGDEYANLTLALRELHTVIHATKPETISTYLTVS